MAAKTFTQTCNQAEPVTLTQAGTTYRGHWHGDYAVFSDGSVFKAHWGWIGRLEGKAIIAQLCNCEAN